MDPEDKQEHLPLYYGIPLLYKRFSTLSNKSTFRDFYPYELRPNESNLNELRRALKDFIAQPDKDSLYHFHYSGVDYEITIGDITNVLGFLMKTEPIDDSAERDYGPHPLVLNPITQAADKYEFVKDGKGYYSRSSILIPNDYLIEKFISIEARYIGDFDYIFGFPPSFLFGLFSYNQENGLYPEKTAIRDYDDAMKKVAKFFEYTPFSLKNFSGVSAFLESVTRMILMDVIDQSIFEYDKDGISTFYWNTKAMGLKDGKDYEKLSSVFLNIALDYLYMAMHSNYYARGMPQNRYIRSIRDAYMKEYENHTGDIKFMSARYGFHPETVVSYALYPFISMIYSGFLSGFSPSVMINYGQTVFRTFVAKQLRWFRYSWHWDAGVQSIGFYTDSERGRNPWSRHNFLYFAQNGAFGVSDDDVDFLRKTMIVPLEEFVKDYDSESEIQKYASDKDRKAAGAYLEYLKDAIDWLDHRMTDDEFRKVHPDIGYSPEERSGIKKADDPDAGNQSMISWVRGILSPYVESHEEKEYSPFPHLFSNRGLFKSYVNPYDFLPERDTAGFSDSKELEFYREIFEKNPLLQNVAYESGLLSPPLTQPIDEYKFNILLDDSDSGFGAIAQGLIDYYFSGFNPKLPFRPLPLMYSTISEGFNFYISSAETVAPVEYMDIPFVYNNNLFHLRNMYDVSERISSLSRGISKRGESYESTKEELEKIEKEYDFQPFGYNYYYFLASKTGNFFYDENPVEDLNTGEKAPLYIERMNRVMFASSYEGEFDNIYRKALPVSWFTEDDPNEPSFKSDKLFPAVDRLRLFKDGFQALLDGDMLLMASDDYKNQWVLKHNGLSPNAYEYCEVI